MTTILEQRSSIKTAIDSGISAFAHVFTHGGPFSFDDLKRYAVKAPAAVVACVNIPEFEERGTAKLLANVQWSIYVVTRGDSSTRRDAEALTLITALAKLVQGNFWEDADEEETADERPQRIRGSNMRSTGLDKSGVALWALAWNQKIDIADFDLTTLGNFDKFYAEWDLAEADDTIDAEDNIRGIYTS